MQIPICCSIPSKGIYGKKTFLPVRKLRKQTLRVWKRIMPLRRMTQSCSGRHRGHHLRPKVPPVRVPLGRGA